MKKIHIFKPGTHTSANGSTIDFSEDKVKAIVDNYDPTIHEAPIVIGHPSDNIPAFGWIKALSFSDKGIHAEPHQLDPDFSEMVAQGKFKKVSASFYSPNSPNNPTPGSYSLRHVGFLGAQPPAVKGLEPLQFGEEDDELLIEFEESLESAWLKQDQAGLFRRLREFLIEKFSKEDADQVIPSYVVEGMENHAKTEIDNAHNKPNFSDPQQDPIMTEEEIKALQAENERLTNENQSFSEQIQGFTDRENALKAAERTQKVEKLVAQGRITPAQVPAVTSFMEALAGNDVSVDFGEGDNKTTAKGEEALNQFLASMPKQVDFSEQAPGEENEPAEMSAAQLAQQAQDYQEEQAEKGVTLTIDQAVQAVASGKYKTKE
ncbi:hypothetical protein tloyanaT_13140 [Thalassotalea loyana]|uniref:Peptidase n=1 Tax=Thalassotalea loyana TaxID=280483 RepID=A0ABQ6HAB0_9GAMM|nr:phage protease [Thalassotalea loyana]GLX85062.1 hypothetical protein tloyanaT_13140 [Thalassotalea loyana]